MYSFGVICWEVLTWTIPFSNENHWQVGLVVPNGLVRFVRNHGRLNFAGPLLRSVSGRHTRGWQALIELDYAFPHLTPTQAPTHPCPPTPPHLVQLVRFVAEGGRLEFPEPSKLPGPGSGEFEGLQDYIALVNRCWAQDPKDRPSFQQIVDDLRCGLLGLFFVPCLQHGE